MRCGMYFVCARTCGRHAAGCPLRTPLLVRVRTLALFARAAVRHTRAALVCVTHAIYLRVGGRVSCFSHLWDPIPNLLAGREWPWLDRTEANELPVPGPSSLICVETFADRHLLYFRIGHRVFVCRVIRTYDLFDPDGGGGPEQTPNAPG